MSDKNDISLDFNGGLIRICGQNKRILVRGKDESVGLEYSNESGCVYIPYDCYNPFLDDIFILKEDGEEDFSWLFESFFNDKARLERDGYFENEVIHSKLRSHKGEALFYHCYNHLALYETKDYRTGAILSVCSYRMSESEELRKKYLDKLFGVKKEFDSAITLSNPLIVRWYVSSCAPMSVCLLADNRVEKAKELLLDLKRNAFYTLSNPLTYWNFAFSLQVLGLIEFYQGNKDEAISIFLNGFSYCSSVVSVLNTGYNNWLLSQFHDLRALLDLQQNFMALAYHAAGGKIVHPYIKKPKVLEVPRARIDFLLRRYPVIIECEKSFFKKVFYNINRNKG